MPASVTPRRRCSGSAVRMASRSSRVSVLLSCAARLAACSSVGLCFLLPQHPISHATTCSISGTGAQAVAAKCKPMKRGAFTDTGWSTVLYINGQRPPNSAEGGIEQIELTGSLNQQQLLRRMLGMATAPAALSAAAIAGDAAAASLPRHHRLRHRLRGCRCRYGGCRPGTQ
eukprot:scaffold3867_cov59-Phaeocystis_antarctica.AAC.1